MAVELESAGAIARTLGLDEHGLKIVPVGSGDIADACVLQAADYWVFVKMLPVGDAGILSAEEDGLKAIAATDTVRVPRFIRRGQLDRGSAWLAMEYLDLEARTEQIDGILGTQLAHLHRVQEPTFGWHRNNFIGRSVQHNPRLASWTEFFLQHRLGPQFDSLARHHPDGSWPELRDATAEAWTEQFADHNPPPSLIHGDLWKGNAAALGKSEPVVFDPAVHFADRECDLAMTRLFGGFADTFYEAYQAEWPLPEGHERRQFFYKLYHLLNHANLFAGDYLDAAGKLCHSLMKGA